MARTAIIPIQKIPVLRRIIVLGISFLFVTPLAYCQNIITCLRLIDFDAPHYIAADILIERTDTIVDLRLGYFEMTLEELQDLKLCQAAKFNNSDRTVTLGITGYYADEQCSNHPTYFYEISKAKNSFVELEISDILPNLQLTHLLDQSKCTDILTKYLPEIRENYLGADATIEDVLEEIYDFHIILPRKGTTITVTLTTCDYIPRNEVGITTADWNAIENCIKTVEFTYDRTLKRFDLVDFKH